MWIVIQHYNISYVTVRGNFFYNCRESFKVEAKFGRPLTVHNRHGNCLKSQENNRKRWQIHESWYCHLPDFLAYPYISLFRRIFCKYEALLRISCLFAAVKRLKYWWCGFKLNQSNKQSINVFTWITEIHCLTEIEQIYFPIVILLESDRCGGINIGSKFERGRIGVGTTAKQMHPLYFQCHFRSP